MCQIQLLTTVIETSLSGVMFLLQKSYRYATKFLKSRRIHTYYMFPNDFHHDRVISCNKIKTNIYNFTFVQVGETDKI